MNKSADICNICGEAHAIQNRCSYDALTRRIVKLLETNKHVPSLMQANVEATDLANTFKHMAQDAAKALVICEKAVMEFDNGPQIWTRFQERLEQEWPKTKETSNPDTEQQLSLPESTTPSETENKPCTGEIVPGKAIEPDFLP